MLSTIIIIIIINLLPNIYIICTIIITLKSFFITIFSLKYAVLGVIIQLNFVSTCNIDVFEIFNYIKHTIYM